MCTKPSSGKNSKAIHGYYTVSGKSGSLAYTSTPMYISPKLLHV